MHLTQNRSRNDYLREVPRDTAQQLVIGSNVIDQDIGIK